MMIEIVPDNNTLRRPKRSERWPVWRYGLCSHPAGWWNFAKYYIVAGHYCYPLPDHLNAEDGTLVEPAAVSVQICKVADLRAGQTVVVFVVGRLEFSVRQLLSLMVPKGLLELIFPNQGQNLRRSVPHTTFMCPHLRGRKDRTRLIQPVSWPSILLRNLASATERMLC